MTQLHRKIRWGKWSFFASVYSFFLPRHSNASLVCHGSHDLDREFRPKMVKRSENVGRSESSLVEKNQLISISRRPRAREGNFQFVAAPKSEECQKRREARGRVCIHASDASGDRLTETEREREREREREKTQRWISNRRMSLRGFA